MPQSSDSKAIWSRVRKPIIWTFFIFYFAIMLLESLAPFKWRTAIHAPLQPFLSYSGLWQNFQVFSPGPRQKNLFLTAEIKFADGSTESWDYPRPEKMGFLEKIARERYRKYGHDHLFYDDESFLWPDFCRWLARQFTDKGKRPVTITLIRHWAEIPPPSEESLAEPLPPEDEYFRQRFYTYRLTSAGP